jgi:hypothetical protein
VSRGQDHTANVSADTSEGPTGHAAIVTEVRLRGWRTVDYGRAATSEAKGEPTACVTGMEAIGIAGSAGRGWNRMSDFDDWNRSNDRDHATRAAARESPEPATLTPEERAQAAAVGAGEHHAAIKKELAEIAAVLRWQSARWQSARWR